MLDVYICVGSSCHIKGSYQVINTFQELISRYSMQDRVEIKASFCLGHCTEGVSIKVGEDFIEGVTINNCAEKFDRYIKSRVMEGL
jgi:NADH:ubiquinone oxidoreductase subunit E